MNPGFSDRPINRFTVPAVVLGTILSACTEATTPDPLILGLIAGDEQEAQANTALPDSLVVKVTGVDGLPRENVRVMWLPSPGDGNVLPRAKFTDAEGLLKAFWTLGPDLGGQTVTVSAPGTSTVFRAWATPPPPVDWLDVLEIQPEAVLQGEVLLTRVGIWSTWPGTIRLKTPESCLITLGYPALYSSTGERVAHASSGCWTVPTYHFIPPGDTLFHEWEMGIQEVNPGQYTLRYRFDVHEVNGTPTLVPDIDISLPIGS